MKIVEKNKKKKKVTYFSCTAGGGYFAKLESELLSKIDPKNAQRPSTVDNKGQAKSKLKKTSKPNS